jgi:hypothetical protein
MLNRYPIPTKVDKVSEDKVHSTKLMGVTYVPLVKPSKHPYY